MENNNDYSHLLDRIKTLDASKIVKISPEIVAKLTDDFSESLVREMLYTESMNQEQRIIIHAVKSAYKNWKQNTDQFWGNPPLFPERYPEYLEDLQTDIECGMVVTTKGSFEEDHARLKISLIPSGAVPVKSYPKADQSTEQIDKVDTIKNNTQDTDEKSKLIAELRETISQMKVEFEQYKQEQSITQEQLDAIFPLNEKTDGKHQQQVVIPQTDNKERLKTKAELEEKEKKLEEANKRIIELEAQVEEVKHQNEKSAKDSLDWLEDWQQLSTRELAIFFAQALGVSFDPELVVQTQLANLAATWTKPQPDTIRAKIGKLFNEESDVNEKKLDGFSHKTKGEALDVYYFIMRIAKHYSCITPQMNKILNNLNELYNLGIVEKVDVNNKEKQITKKEIFDTIDKTRKSGEKNH